VTSFNRNFSKRNDGKANTKAFVTSPEIVVAYALAGTLEFDPLTDFVPTSVDHNDAAGSTERGAGFMFEPPTGDVLPPLGFERSATSVCDVATARNFATDEGVGPNRGAVISVSPRSERLQLLQPFPEWDGKDYLAMPVLVKAKGKCTTDHISAAGRWLRYRGHLENISGNLFLGATNAFTGSVGEGKDPVDQKTRPYPEIAKHLSEQGVRWCAVGDWNYGEGSSREHAAMEPRYRGAAVIFARSFARIHETNLKKQGVLPLVFSDPSTYDAIGEDALLSVLGLASLEPDRGVECSISRPDGNTVAFSCSHTLNLQQIEWFRAGSALNVIRRLRGQPNG
jgi:aconitate hydratase